MKLAIHHINGSFSEEWLRYCKENDIDYKLVNCYDYDIVRQLEGCAGLMWHWSQVDSRAILFARQLTYSLEKKGIKVFPDSRTCWHFDDKVGQKYLLECINAPLVPSVVFYDRQQARDWANHTIYPKVFKLRGGAGSVNVKLVEKRSQALKLIRKAFGRGFQSVNRINRLNDKFMRMRQKRNLTNLIYIIKGLVRLLYPSYDDRMQAREKGYIYFQEFIPGNNHDIRVVVIGKRAFAIKRYVRKNDFRASGSGNLVFNRDEIPIECVKSAFHWTGKLDSQCVCFDFVSDKGMFLLVEISYGFASKAYLPCPGFWDKNLNWHPGRFISEWFMIEDFISTLQL
jgi:glutathione synthase/RimK-type ligase-like ATP-grasp enzyme